MPVADDLIEIAKRNLVKHGYLEPVFFLLDNDQFVYSPSSITTLGRIAEKINGEKFNLEDSKTQTTFMIGMLAKAFGATHVIMLWEGAFKTVNNPRAFQDDTERPLLYPKSMRTECIILNEVFLPSGKDNTRLIPFKGGDGEPVEFLENTDVDEAIKKGGNFKSRFTETILEGYNKART